MISVSALGIGTGQLLAQGSPAPSATPVDIAQIATADALWQYIQDIQKPPKAQPKSESEFRAAMSTMVGQLFVAATEFSKRYPNDPRKWDAQLIAIEAHGTMQRVSGRPDEVETRMGLQGVANEQDAPSKIRAQARYQLLGMAIGDYTRGSSAVTADAIMAQLNQFISDFSSYPGLDALKYRVAETLKASDPATTDKLLNELAKSGEGQVEDQARKELATEDKLKKPIELHFAATDGTEVDIAKMRGKVVLVDFWATWCPPCRQEVPNVLSTYNKYHAKGFEIIGISLDQKKDALSKFTMENGMTWPQYCDGKGWENAISSGFGIQEIPTMWLVNKKGLVVSTNGRMDLGGQVEKLLGE